MALSVHDTLTHSFHIERNSKELKKRLKTMKAEQNWESWGVLVEKKKDKPEFRN